MDPKHLEELIAVERGYWWHVAKRELVLEVLGRHFPPPARLVEGGIGGGAHPPCLPRRGSHASGSHPCARAGLRRLGLRPDARGRRALPEDGPRRRAYPRPRAALAGRARAGAGRGTA